MGCCSGKSAPLDPNDWFENIVVAYLLVAVLLSIYSYNQMNASFFTSTEMIPKSFVENMNLDFRQGLIYNLNQDQLAAIALRLAHFFPWGNISTPHYFVPPFSNFNNVFFWPGHPKSDGKCQDLESKDFLSFKGNL